MALKFLKIFISSAIASLFITAVFYILSVSKSVVSEAYTSTDTVLGSVFIFLLGLIIGLSVWPKILERR